MGIGIIIEVGIEQRIMLIILGLLIVYWAIMNYVGELVWGFRLHSNGILKSMETRETYLMNTEHNIINQSSLLLFKYL
jgi:hypothetical protein